MPDLPPSLSYTTLSKPYGGVRDLRGTMWLLGWCIAVSAAGTLPFAVTVFVGTGFWMLGAIGLQFLIIAGGLITLFERTPMQKQRGLFLLAAMTAVLALGFTQVSIYLHDLFELSMTLNNDSIAAALSELFTGRVFRVHALIIPQNWPFGGFVNNFAWRVTSSPAFVRISTIHALLLAVVSYLSVKAAKKHDWCDACGTVIEPKNLLVLPASAAGDLAQTVRANSCGDAARLSEVGVTADLGVSCVVARQLLCDSCGRQRLDVVCRGGGLDACVVEPMEVSDELVLALRSTPVLKAEQLAATPTTD